MCWADDVAMDEGMTGTKFMLDGVPDIPEPVATIELELAAAATDATLPEGP